MDKFELLKTAKPILFNTDMVRAILDNRKTVTRRVVKDIPKKHERIGWDDGKVTFGVTDRCKILRSVKVKPKYKIGDILYVRETFGTYDSDYVGYCLYKADFKNGQKYYMDGRHRCDLPKWKPSIHMPNEYARIFLRVTDVRVERLQDITEEEAVKEGVKVILQAHSGIITYLNYMHDNKNNEHWEYACNIYHSAIASYASLWTSILPLEDWDIYGWDANPWVFVYEFEKLEVKKGE